MTDATEPGGTDVSPERRARLLVVLASALLLIGSTAAGYFLGRDLAKRPLNDALQLVHQLQPQVQKQKQKIDEQATTIIKLQTELKRAETDLRELRPAKDTFHINTNQSLILGNGKLTIGLVGPPAINGVVININGKQHRAVTGDVFDVAPDAQTACTVKVQSFDMFEVNVNATCGKGK